MIHRLKSKKQKLMSTAILGIMTLMGSANTHAEVASSVETGLKSLAEQISSKIAATDKKTIAVLAFPNADGSCSVLSTYLVDKLTNSIFLLPNSPLKIVERSQLESLINEKKFGDINDPKIAKQVGNLSGVNALTVGTITQIGDNIDITARLVSTETGQTISVASVEVPQTDTVKNLLKQPLRSGPTCGGIRVTQTPHDQSTGAAATTASADSSTASTAPVALADSKNITQEGISIHVDRVTRSKDKKSLAMVLFVINTNPEPVEAIFVGPTPSYIDDQTNTGEAYSINGIAICGNVNSNTKKIDYMSDSTGCTNLNPTQYTVLSPNTKVTALMRFGTESTISGATASFASRLLIRFGGKKDGSGAESKTISLTMPDLALGE